VGVCRLASQRPHQCRGIRLRLLCVCVCSNSNSVLCVCARTRSHHVPGIGCCDCRPSLSSTAADGSPPTPADRPSPGAISRSESDKPGPTTGAISWVASDQPRTTPHAGTFIVVVQRRWASPDSGLGASRFPATTRDPLNEGRPRRQPQILRLLRIKAI
jgi:hypothetical protein